MGHYKYSKTRLSLFIVLLVSFMSYCQDIDKSTLKFKSWSVTPLELYDFQNRTEEMFTGIVPISITLDVTFAITRNLFSISGTYGEESGIFSGSASIKQISFLYGREFELKKWLLAETHFGGGLFLYSSSEFEKNISELAIPLVGKLRFKTGERFSIGLRLSYNINSFNNFYSAGISLQWSY